MSEDKSVSTINKSFFISLIIFLLWVIAIGENATILYVVFLGYGLYKKDDISALRGVSAALFVASFLAGISAILNVIQN